LLSLFQTTNCDYGFYYTGVIMGMYCQIGLTMSQFMLNLELRIRLALAVVFSLVGVLFNVVRTEGIKDKSFPYDPIWVTALPALGFVSYFADYTLRSAFASARQLRALLKKTMGKQHQAAKAALDVMLPPFVSARLLSSSSADKALKEAEDDEEDRGPKSEQSIAENGKEESVDLGGSLTDRQFSSQNLLGDESQGGMLDTASFTNSEKLWEFSGVCVMFCYFKVKMYEGGSEHHRIETIGQAIQQIERILVAEGIHKIKTIGPSVLCVSGIQGEPDAVCNMVTACQAIRKQVFGTHLDWDFTIGLNFGPCFGAVLGTTNLMFDIFGDTVNTASRMQSNAPNRAIQVSTSVYDTLTGDLTSANGLAGSMSLTSGVHSPLHSSPTSTKTRNNRFKFTKREPIQVKGKGLLDAYLLLPEEGEVETDK
jgi:class 3 adenylate cyclase